VISLSAVEPTPSPTPTDFDPNTVTPGWEGFTVIFIIAALVVLLIIDMVRRIRRVRYREEIRAKLEAEQAASPDGDDLGR
jgi:hypothetical protein